MISQPASTSIDNDKEDNDPEYQRDDDSEEE